MFERLPFLIEDHATNMPSAVYFGKKSGENFPITESVKYAYDRMGNISRIDENGAPVVWYKYDALNRLIREDNKTFGKTWQYSYDNNGNILCKRETAFTLKENVEESEFTSVQYEYEGDKLLAYGTEACEYDAIGNPTTYRGIIHLSTKKAETVRGDRGLENRVHTAERKKYCVQVKKMPSVERPRAYKF